MKNTFAVTMTLLLALTLGGSYAGYRIATTPHHPENVAEEAHGGAETSSTMAGAPGDDVVSNQEAAVNAGEAEPLAAPGGTGPNSVQNQNVNNLQAEAGGLNAGVSGTVPQTGLAAGGENPTGENTEVATGEQADEGAERSEEGVSSDPTASPTAQGTEDTELGQTGASNTEKAVAGSPGASNSQAAEVASATNGDTGQGQEKFTASCAGCHGAQAQGGLGPALNGATGSGTWTVSEFERAVREGHAPDRELAPTMPRFTEAQLSDEDLMDIYAYLKSL